MNRERVIIYGLGKFFHDNKEKIMEQYTLIGGVDRNKKSEDEIKIISISEIDKEQFDKIVIMVMDMQESIKIAKQLKNEYNVSSDRICFGFAIFGRNGISDFECIEFTNDEKLLLTFGSGEEKFKIKVSSVDEYNNICEVLIDRNYEYYINNNKRDVVVDIGLNIGGAALFFLKQEKVEKVYGYEPFKETFGLAKENLKEYMDKPEKLEIYQYGISNKTEYREIGYNPNMSCGQSTLYDVHKKNEKIYLDGGYIEIKDSRNEKIEVREASIVLSNIIQKHSDQNIVLKIDCEGEEYGILENLLKSGELDRVSFIMLEWHWFGKEKIFQYLKEAHFSYWCADKSKDMGLVYAYRNENIC